MDDSLILRAALDRGWITARQLTDALRACAAGEAGGFGDLLVARGWIDADRALRLRAETRAGPHAGRFVLLRELGRGGMGTVHEGWDPKLRRRVAVKMLGDALAEKEDVARFYQEARTAASIQHPNIVRIHEIGKEGGRPFIVMDLLEGGTLAGRKLPPREAARTLAAVARAVDEAHRRGIIHRDLKPQNVLLDAEGSPCVADFGLAKRLAGSSKLTATGFVVGTPNYMAPEQARGLVSQIDARSDVYALGAVLFEVLTGRQAVEGTSILDALRRAATEDVRRPSSVDRALPRELDAIVLAAMARDRARRYPSAAALADDLDRWLAGRPIRARAPSRGLALLRRHPVAFALAVSLGAAAVLTAALLRPPAPPPEPPAPSHTARAPALPARARAQPEYDAALRLLDESRLDFYRPEADLGRTRARLTEAAARFGAALAIHPEFGEALLARGHAYVLLRRPAEAHADYSKAIELLPGSAEARLARGRLSLDRVTEHLATASWRREEIPAALRALLKEAEADLRRARDLGLAGAALRYLEGALAYLGGNYADAVARLDETGIEGPLLEDLLRLRAKAWGERAATGTEAEQRRCAEASLADFTRLLGLRCHDAQARRLRASINFLSGKPAEAKADFEAALRADPTDSLAIFDMAVFLYRSGRPEGVETLLDRALTADPSNMRALSLRGVLKLERSDVAGARADLEKSVAAHPDYLPGLLNLAICQEMLGDAAGSLKSLNDIVERQPGLAVAVYSRGVLHFKQGRWKEALADLERATSLAPAKYRSQSRDAIEECRRRLAGR